MPISEEAFARLQKTQPYKSADALKAEAATSASEQADAAAGDREKQKTGFIEGMNEHIKAALLSPTDLARGVRDTMIKAGPASPAFYPAVASKLYEGALQYMEQMRPGTVPEVMDAARLRANVVDQKKIENEGFWGTVTGAATEGIISNVLIPGGGAEKLAVKGIEAVRKTAAPILKATVDAGKSMATDLGKKALVGIGAGEGSEVGRWVLGGLGDLVGGEKGREAGETLGSIAGGAAGGQANVMRVKGTAVGVKKVGEVGMGAAKATVGSVIPAVKEVIAAKRAGDERAATEIFMSHYSALRDKSMGMLQQSTNQKFADIIAHDPDSQPELTKYIDAITRTEVPDDLFSIGQKAANKTLTQIEIQQRLTKEGAAAADVKKKGQKKAIIDSYKRITDKALPTDPASLEESAKIFQTGTTAQLDTLAADTKAVKDHIPNWNDTEAAKQGGKLRELRDKEHEARKAEDEKNYQGAYNQADAEGLRINLAPVGKEVSDVLKPLLAKIDTGTVPNSIRALNNLLIRESKPAPSKLILPEGVTPPKEVVGHSLKQVDDVIKMFSKDAHEARVAGDYAEANNLETIHRALLNQVNKQASPAVAQSYNGAQREYADKTVPRFKHGVAYNLDRDAAISRRGREQITDQNVFSQYLNKGDLVDRMEQFDATFGGNHGTPKNKEAYKILGDAVADRYSKEVLQKGFTRENHEKFLREYNSALDQVPEIRGPLDHAANTIDANNQKSQVLVNHYKQVMDGPITDVISPAHMEQLLINSLKDSTKMKEILASPLGNTPEAAQSLVKELMLHARPFKGDKYDASELEKLLNTGEHRVGEPSSMQLLFNKALGVEKGAEHMANLKAIAELMKREAMTDSSYMRFQNQGGKGPVEQATGQGAPSWLALYYASKSGRIGVPYAAGVAAGRFVNNSMAKAAEESMQRATYDPEMSKAILELAATPSNQQISGKAWKLGIGAADGAAKMFKNLTDHGLIKSNVVRGAMVGIEQADQEQDKPKKPKRVLDLPR